MEGAYRVTADIGDLWTFWPHLNTKNSVMVWVLNHAPHLQKMYWSTKTVKWIKEVYLLPGVWNQQAAPEGRGWQRHAAWTPAGQGAGGSRLVAGGSRLAAGGSPLAAGGSPLGAGGSLRGAGGSLWTAAAVCQALHPVSPWPLTCCGTKETIRLEAVPDSMEKSYGHQSTTKPTIRRRMGVSSWFMLVILSQNVTF